MLILASHFAAQKGKNFFPGNLTFFRFFFRLLPGLFLKHCRPQLKL
jgi:hypothetical protein